MKTRQRAPKTAEDIHALVKNAERLRERRSIRLAQASLAAAVGFMLMTASHVVDTPTVLWVALVALAACVALMVTAWDTHAEVRDLEETLRGFTPQELLYGPSPEPFTRRGPSGALT
jgi:Na+/H+ antiporter NhaD/arsenite permease-like protein